LVQGGLTWNVLVSAYVIIGVIAVVAFSAALMQFRKVIG